jgi:hypothetical protein
MVSVSAKKVKKKFHACVPLMFSQYQVDCPLIGNHVSNCQREQTALLPI